MAEMRIFGVDFKCVWVLHLGQMSAISDSGKFQFFRLTLRERQPDMHRLRTFDCS